MDLLQIQLAVMSLQKEVRDFKELLKLNSQKAEPSAPTFMSIDEAAKFMGVSSSTLYKKACKGEIPHYKIGGLKFDRNELDQYIRKHKVASITEIQTLANDYSILNNRRRR